MSDTNNVLIVLRPEQVDLLLSALSAWEARMTAFDDQSAYKNQAVSIATAYCRKRCDEVRAVLDAALAAQPSTPVEDEKV